MKVSESFRDSSAVLWTSRSHQLAKRPLGSSPSPQTASPGKEASARTSRFPVARCLREYLLYVYYHLV
jgi:hypothetical protein